MHRFPAAPIALSLPDVCVGLATPPVMLALIGGQLLAQSGRELSRLGEDLLRGERLPLLHFPHQPPVDP